MAYKKDVICCVKHIPFVFGSLLHETCSQEYARQSISRARSHHFKNKTFTFSFRPLAVASQFFAVRTSIELRPFPHTQSHRFTLYRLRVELPRPHYRITPARRAFIHFLTLIADRPHSFRRDECSSLISYYSLPSLIFSTGTRNHLQMQKRDSKSFDTGSLQSRCQTDEMDSNVVENRFMAAAAIHQSCDDGLFNDKNKMGFDSNERFANATDISSQRPNHEEKHSETEQPNEVTKNEPNKN